jgi:hypothetical protein
MCTVLLSPGVYLIAVHLSYMSHALLFVIREKQKLVLRSLFREIVKFMVVFNP